MSEDTVNSQEYEVVALGDINPSHTIKFLNPQNEQVGVLDFNGPGLLFEGNAEMSAIIFIDWIAKIFSERLKEEYEHGLADGLKWAAENTKDFTQGTLKM